MKIRIKWGWIKWREVLGDRKMPILLKDRFCVMVLRLITTYGLQFWAVNTKAELRVQHLEKIKYYGNS